jgi:hypothetical protein
MQRRILDAPLSVAFPQSIFKLVLHVEQPDADRCGHQHDRQMHQQKGAETDQPDQQRRDHRNREVCRHDADPRPPAGAHEPDRQTMLQQEQIGRADAEHHDRMPVQTIGQPAPGRPGPILVHSQRVDVANAAAVEIARGGVVSGVSLPPEVVRRQCQHTEHPADPVVCKTLTKEGAMPAIVLDHEQSQQEAGGEHGKRRKSPPVPEMNGGPRYRPQHGQRHEGDDEFDDAARMTGLAIGMQRLEPVFCILHDERAGRSSAIFQRSSVGLMLAAMASARSRLLCACTSYVYWLARAFNSNL